MGNIANGELNTFVDGQIVSANDATYGLNPKMEVIRAAVNDNDSRIGVLEGQIGAVGGLFYNVKASPYNAVGDGVADDTVAIQAAITAAITVNGTVIIPKGTYRLTNDLTIAGSCVIRSDGTGQSSILRQTVASKSIFIINSSNVWISDLVLDAYATSSPSMIYSNTATASSPYLNIYIDQCKFYSSNNSTISAAIQLQQVSFIRITGCVFTANFMIQTIKLFSCLNAEISKNNFGKSTGSTVLLSRSSGTLTDYPHCRNVVIYQNTFLDGVQYSVLLASVINCYVDSNQFSKPSGSSGYAFIYTSTVDNVNSAYVVVSNNYFDGRIGGLGGETIGVHLTGATRTTIESNHFFECGTGAGCIYVQSSALTAVSNIQVLSNYFAQCSTYAVNFATDATVVINNSIISNNTIIDIYSSTITCAVVNHDSLTFLTITGNVLVRGTKSATNVNNFGVKTSYASNNARILSSGNNFSAALDAPYYFSVANTVCLYNEDITGDRIFYGFALTAPASGTFRQGDKLMLLSPTAGGYIGYVCTTAGSPGTWKGFGAIQV